MTSYRALEAVDFGTDGDVSAVVIPGHVPVRIALAALSRHAREVWGWPGLLDGPYRYEVTEPPQHLYLESCDQDHGHPAVYPDTHDHIHAAPGPGREPFTAVWIA